MADREKLIECLKYCASTSTTQNNCHGCKRWDFDCGSYHCVDDLMMQVAAALEQQQWIPVTERLPEHDGQYLCNYHFGTHRDMTFTRVLDYYATDKVPHFQHTLGDTTMKVTHWMPLPEPPKGE